MIGIDIDSNRLYEGETVTNLFNKEGTANDKISMVAMWQEEKVSG